MAKKKIEEYTMTMTREEFDQFTEKEAICPSIFGLVDTFTGDQCNDENCKACYDKALEGKKFKINAPALPNETLPILKSLGDLEVQAKSIKEQQDKLKADLLIAMETHGVKKWDNEIMTISYTAATKKTTLDSAKIKTELPAVYEQYTKTSNVKSSIKIKLKEDKQ